MVYKEKYNAKEYCIRLHRHDTTIIPCMKKGHSVTEAVSDPKYLDKYCSNCSKEIIRVDLRSEQGCTPTCLCRRVGER